VVLYHIHSDKASGTVIALLGRTHTKVTKASTIRNIYEIFLQLRNLTLANVSVSCNSTQFRRQSVKIKRFPVLLEISVTGDSQRTADGTKTKHVSSLMEYSHQVVSL
jgi:hypothetical protein